MPSKKNGFLDTFCVGFFLLKFLYQLLTFFQFAIPVAEAAAIFSVLKKLAYKERKRGRGRALNLRE
jgi:hypothetical protein